MPRFATRWKLNSGGVMQEDLAKNSLTTAHDPVQLSSLKPARDLHCPYNRGCVVAALLVAVASDALSLVFQIALPLQWVLDAVTALLLFAVLGWQPWLLPALVAEAIPGVATMPVWVLVVAIIVGKGKRPMAPSPKSDPGDL